MGCDGQAWHGMSQKHPRWRGQVHGMIITRMMNGDLMIITRMTIMFLTRLNIGEIMFGRISWTRMMFDSLARVTVPALHSLALESVAASQPAGEASAVPIRWTLAPGT